MCEQLGVAGSRQSMLERVVRLSISSDEMASWISEVTGEEKTDVLGRLWSEYQSPGSTVRDEFVSRGLTPFVWNEQMELYYEQSNAFVYELAIWNWNKIKQEMRDRTIQYLPKTNNERLRILMMGDGLGFDSVALANRGHQVTYFELPSYSQRFAENLFNRCGLAIERQTDPEQIQRGQFDAIICLDVLEHVPNPSQFVNRIATYLKPNSRMIVHSPFYLIHSNYPTHLRANRQYSGSLRPYRGNGLRLVDGYLGWNPVVLERGDPMSAPGAKSVFRRWTIRAAGCFLGLGRLGMLPLNAMHRNRCKSGRWFDELSDTQNPFNLDAVSAKS